MSLLSDNPRQRQEQLKKEILDLHKGADPEATRQRIAEQMGRISYEEVVQVEQELIAEGLPVLEVTDLCDIHSRVLEGQIDVSGVKPMPPGHPVHTFTAENNALANLVTDANNLLDELKTLPDAAPVLEKTDKLLAIFRLIYDVDKHYRRKEYLLFPFMEKHGITGPPKVMWGKHDQIRAQLKTVIARLSDAAEVTAGTIKPLANTLLRPALMAVTDMITKESKILLPMCLEALEPIEWYDIARQSPEIGFCLYDPQVEWVPENAMTMETDVADKGRIVFPTGSLTLNELAAMLKTLPLDLTFVDKNDTVRFFSHGPQPIFDRNRSVIGRQVQMCHPPKSVHIVNKILDDFRSGKENKAEFWIDFQERFVHITYYAVRDALGEYLGTVELTMDISHQRGLQGEQRLLDYEVGKP
ncbi:MAG: DUF438 domain-containing protein [Calditrichota bacterium]